MTTYVVYNYDPSTSKRVTFKASASEPPHIAVESAEKSAELLLAYSPNEIVEIDELEDGVFVRTVKKYNGTV
jgi:hypothetical protein